MTSNLDLENRLLTLCVPGDLISTNAEELRTELTRLLGTVEGAPSQWQTFRLDLARARMVDSVGLNLVVGLLKRLRKRGAKLQVAYASQNVLRTFTFTRLDKHVEMVKA